MKNVSLIINHKSLIIKAISILLLFTIQVTGFPAVSYAQGSTLSATLAPQETPTQDLTTQTIQQLSDLNSTHSGVLNSEENGLQYPLPNFSNPQNQFSATTKSFPIVRALSKRSFKSDERVELNIDNAENQTVTVNVVDKSGQDADFDFFTIDNGPQKTVVVKPKRQFKPGSYKIVVVINGQTYTQDFTWGVLAINTNKSILFPNETAKISMAVLDETGNMVCDANVKLNIKNKILNIDDTLSTDNGKITINPQCQLHSFSFTPDYQASYQVGQAGTYTMTLTADTKNGSYSISDSFEVRDSVPFDVERITATRIYPPNSYPVQFNIIANEDFEGAITEAVPGDFAIEQLQNSAYPFEEIKTVSSTAVEQVLGASTSALITPFNGNFPISEEFSEKLKNAGEKNLYARFNLAGHDGVDFDMVQGTPVLAADDGVVVMAGGQIYGTTIVIEHSWGRSYYGHLSKTNVFLGQVVKRGDEIGLSGNTGITTGPHLHFGIKPNNPDMGNGYYGKIDPLPFLGIQSRLGLANQVKLIKFKVSLKKGDRITLGYSYKAPNTSPQFYMLGPLSFVQNSRIIFKEQRQWQIAVDVTSTIEQQINIIDQAYSTASTSYTPTDNSLGLIRWDSSRYPGATVYFEAVLSNGFLNNVKVALFSSSGTQITNSEVAATSETFIRQRSSALILGSLPNLQSGLDYTVRVLCGGSPCSGNVKVARLIIVQSNASAPTDTQTQVEVGNNENTTGTTYADLTDKKIYRYTSGAWSPSPTVNFEASLKAPSTEGTPTNTGPNNPATGAQDTTVGGTAWDSYTNSFSDNATYDSVSLTKGSISYYNKATNFGFSGIPTDATIKGITVEINGYVSNVLMDDSSVKIVKGGTVTGTDQASATDWPTSDAGAYRTYGGTTNLWGTTWLPSDINSNTGFGVAFAFVNNKTGSPATYTGYIDHIRITVTYAPAVAQTAYAALYTTGGTLVTGSEVSTTSTSWTRARTASSITLSDATDYVVRIKASSGGTAYISNAKIILDQTNAGGITALETVQQYNNTLATDLDSIYTSLNFPNSFNKANWTGGSFTAYFESTLKTSSGTDAYFARLDTPLGEVTGTDTVYTRKRSASDLWSSLPASATDIDGQLKNAAASTTSSSNSWLIIQVSSLGSVESGPTLDQLMRHGKWFSNGAEQPFTF